MFVDRFLDDAFPGKPLVDQGWIREDANGDQFPSSAILVLLEHSWNNQKDAVSLLVLSFNYPGGYGCTDLLALSLFPRT